MTESDRALKEACILAEEMYWDDFYVKTQSNMSLNIPKGQHERIKKIIYGQIDINKVAQIPSKMTVKRIKTFIIAAAIIIILAVTAFAFDPVRNFIINVYNDCTEILFKSYNGNDYLYANYSYIPEGYILIEDVRQETVQKITYSNKEFDIIIKSLSNDNTTRVIDSENAETGEIRFDDNIGYYTITNTNINLIWSSGKYNHSISAEKNENINSVEELVKIAQSRQPLN